MRCDRCPAGWEDRGYEGGCEDFGCLIYGHEICLDNCKLSADTINKRLAELKEYEAGKIERPQWIANRFMRELDNSAIFGGEPHHTSYPPVRMRKGLYYAVYGSIDLHYQGMADYRRGYEDAQDGKEMNYDS